MISPSLSLLTTSMAPHFGGAIPRRSPSSLACPGSSESGGGLWIAAAVICTCHQGVIRV